MKIPVRKRQTSKYLTLPDLSGGLNLREGLSNILDNQLTDCQNMWWQDGILRTRPNFTRQQEKMLGRCKDSNTRVKRHNCFYEENGQKGQLCSVRSVFKVNITAENLYETYIDFFWIFENGRKQLPAVYERSNEYINQRYFVCRQDDFLYCFTNSKKIYTLNLLNQDAKWTRVSESEYYVPLVLTNCKTNGSISMSVKDVVASATKAEGYNLLGKNYRITYNAYNKNVAFLESESGKNCHFMQYFLPKNTYDNDYIGEKVTAVFRNKSKSGRISEATHQIVLQGEIDSGWVWESDYNSIDGLKMGVWSNNIVFKEKDSNGAERTALIYEDNDVASNLEITAPYIPPKEEYNKIFEMTECEWFGGTASGLYSGTRLFLCGNKQYPSLVMWSGINNLLYFPENACFSVGEGSVAVTGFGKQADKLVIFKKNEVWYTQCSKDIEISTYNIKSQNVLDNYSSGINFPLTLINSTIGCCSPETIVLCRNRLVWLGSNGNVYSLVNLSKENESNIYCVSEMLGNKIKNTVDFQNATATDWNGYYCLSVKNNIFLMEYNSYGYIRVGSYSKSEDANMRIPWYYWEVPFCGTVISVSEALIFAEFENYNQDFSNISFYNTFVNSCDKYDVLGSINKDIISSFTTKLFDFKEPNVYKNIEQINLQLGNNNAVPIMVEFISDKGLGQEELLLMGNSVQSNTPDFLESKSVFPLIKQVLRFGLKLTSKGVLAIDSIVFKYKTTKGAR